MEHLEEILTKIREELLAAGKSRSNGPAGAPPAGKQEATLEEYSIKHPDEWHKLLFSLVCQSRGLRTYRKIIDGPRISHVKTHPAVFENLIWPEFMEHGAILERQVKRLMDGLISDIYPDLDELTIGM